MSSATWWSFFSRPQCVYHFFRRGKAPENEYHEPHDTLDRHKIAPQAHYANRPESAKYDTHIEEAPQPSPAPSPAPEHHDMSPAALSEEDKNY